MMSILSFHIMPKLCPDLDEGRHIFQSNICYIDYKGLKVEKILERIIGSIN